MITQLPAGCLEALGRIADAWLAAGAGGLGLWSGERLLVALPPGSSGRGAVVAPIARGRQVVAELRVAAAPGPAAAARAAADAALIGQLLRLDLEVDSVAAELIEVQDQLIGLARLNRSTLRALRPEESLRAVAVETASMLKARAAAVCLAGERGARRASWRPDGGPGPDLPPDLVDALLAPGVERTVRAADEPGLAAAGIGLITLLPVHVQETLITGAIAVIDGPDVALAPAMKLARTFAAVAGGLVERGMLYQDQIARLRMLTEMDLARAVQSNLLPRKAPAVRGLDIFARAMPALHVGGDLYDFIMAQDGSLVFTFGDVTGKGIAAALIMAMTRTALRSKAAHLPSADPLAILERANQDLYDDFTQVEMFATAVVGQVQPGARRLRLANAGHAPVILHSAGARPRLIEAGGIPLGVMPDPRCQPQSEPFGPGDLLVVASDGLTEAEREEEEMFGIERLLELMERSAGATAAELGRRIFAEVAAFSHGRAQSDDRTLIVIRATDEL